MKILRNIPFDEYLDLPGVNYSRLKLMAESRLAYEAYVPGETNAAMALGTLVHAVALGGSEAYVVQPETRINEKGEVVAFVRSGKHWARFVSETAGRPIVRASDERLALEIVSGLHANPVTAAALRDGDRELTVTGELHGTLVRCRLDHVRGQVITDLKTAADHTERGFAAACYRYKYHWQAAMYADAMEAATGLEYSFQFAVAQTVAPYDNALYQCTPEFIAIGRAEYREALEEIKRPASGWLGAYPLPVDLDLPSWVSPVTPAEPRYV